MIPAAALLLVLANCPPDAEPSASKTASVEKAQAKEQVTVRGAAIQTPLEQAVKVSEVVKAPEKLAGKRLLVTGKVQRACSRKGCWLELAEDGAGPKDPVLRVKFKDYAFFVPLDSAGSKARVEGQVEVSVLSEDHAQHLLEEGATLPRGADGKPVEIALVATGVELRR